MRRRRIPRLSRRGFRRYANGNSIADGNHLHACAADGTLAAANAARR
ncbi:MAG: hypothetical protein ACLRUN_14110 [Christensenellales bacterium]